MENKRSSKRSRSASASPAKPTVALSSVSAASFLQESLGSQGDGLQLQIADSGFFNGGSTALEYNSLLHNFGVTNPEQKQRIVDVLQFIQTVGSDSLRQSFRSILECMATAVSVHRHDNDQMAKMRTEINRLYDLVDAGEVERRKTQVAMDERVFSMDIGRDLCFSYLREDGDDEVQSLRDAVSRLELANTSLNDELIRVESEVETKVDEQVALVRATMHDFEAECGQKTAQLNAAQAEMAKLRQKESDMEASSASLQEQVKGVVGLQSRGGLLFDKIALATVSCPIFLLSGDVISMRTLIEMWMQGPSPFDGEVHRPVVYSGATTFVAPREQVEFVFGVAEALGISVEFPMHCEYQKVRGVDEWTQFALYDQVAMASKICKLYRYQTVGPTDFVVVGGGEMKIVFSLQDGHLGFHVQPLVGNATAIMEGRVILEKGWTPFGPILPLM